MRHRVTQQNRLGLGEIAIVEHQQEFRAVRLEALNRMRDPAWEIPQVVLFHVSDETLTVFIDRRDPRRAVEHDRPLTCRVPMQFTNPAGREPHVHARHGLRDGQFPNGHLA